MNFLFYFKAILIGVVEGLTEFLPVSSTAHMLLAEKAIAFQGAPGFVFEIVIQLGAILAILWLYREKLFDVLLRLPHDREAKIFARNVAVAFLPAALAGALLHGYVTTHFFNVTTIAWALLLGGIAIILIERGKRTPRFARTEEFPLIVVLAIGCIQSLALVPGVSRSGATIMGALLLGVERKAAAEFSFFLAIPTMVGASALSLFTHRHELTMDGMDVIATGFIAAFLSALLVVRWMVGFVSRHGFQPFGWYRIGLGLLLLLTVQ